MDLNELTMHVEEVDIEIFAHSCTVLVLGMAHRKWKEIKQHPSMLPGPAVPGSCLVSFHILWAILSTSTV